MQAVLTEEPEETGFNIIYQELTLFTPVVVAAVAKMAAPAVQVAPAAAAMAEITEEEAEEVMESRIQAAAAAERGQILENRALTAAQAL
jgi:predicted lipid-binding transport protein (Tim44 family)